MEKRKPGKGEPIPVLVVGVGHLGKAHARVYKELPGAELVGVVDNVKERAEAIGESLGVPAYDSLSPELLDSVVAASVVTPTRYHLDVARELAEFVGLVDV